MSGESGGTPGFNVSLVGLKDAEVILELIIPWKREQAKRRLKLENLERHAKIQKLNAENKESEARTDRERASIEKDAAQAALIRAEAEKRQAEAAELLAEARKKNAEARKIENEIRLEIIRFTWQLVKDMAPHLAEEKQLDYVTKLLPQIQTIANSPLELTDSSTTDQGS